MRPFPRICAVALAAAAAIPGPLRGQSAYVPLDDVAYVYVDALIARGHLRQLSVLERPYTVGSIVQALEAEARPRRRAALRRGNATRAQSPVAAAGLRERLRKAVSKYEHATGGRSAFRADASASVWATGETSGQRELMLADDLDPTVFAGGAARLLMTAGPVVGFSRTILENRLNSDPDFTGRTDRKVAGRVEDAYVTGQWRYAELFLGRLGRNRGPAQHHGLMLSNAPFTYDHLLGRLGTQRLNISTLLARLETQQRPDGTEVQRYLATHRLAGRWRGIEAAVAESFVYSGVGRGFEPSLANPFTIYGLAWRNEKMDGNLLVSAELAARTRLGIFSGELLIDDLQIDRCEEVCAEPSSYGVTFSAEGVPVLMGQRAFASYTRVASLAYRTPLEGERYSMMDVGLGRAFADYDELRIGADLVIGPAPIRAYFARRRQGSGDYRVLFPDVADYGTHPVIFQPPITRVHRIGLSGGLVFRLFDVRGDIGYNSIGGDLSPVRPMESGFEGRVRLAWNPSWARLRIAP